MMEARRVGPFRDVHAKIEMLFTTICSTVVIRLSHPRTAGHQRGFAYALTTIVGIDDGGRFFGRPR